MRTNQHFGRFRPVPLSHVPVIQRSGRPGIVSSLPVYRDFEKILAKKPAPFEALSFDTAKIHAKLKSPKATIMAAFRKKLREAKMEKQYSVFLRGTVLYLVDNLALSKLKAA